MLTLFCSPHTLLPWACFLSSDNQQDFFQVINRPKREAKDAHHYAVPRLS
jgi:hypothetical protein